MPSLTYKYILKWLQSEFDRLEIEWEPFEMYHTRLRVEDYENGAACYIIRARSKQNKNAIISIRVEDWLKSMEHWIATGKWALTWKPDNSFNINNSYITLKKI